MFCREQDTRNYTSSFILAHLFGKTRCVTATESVIVTFCKRSFLDQIDNEFLHFDWPEDVPTGTFSRSYKDDTLLFRNRLCDKNHMVPVLTNQQVQTVPSRSSRKFPPNLDYRFYPDVIQKDSKRNPSYTVKMSKNPRQSETKTYQLQLDAVYARLDL